MIVRRLAIPLVLWILLVLYLTFVEDIYGITFWVIPPAILLMALYVFSPQIEWWWYQKYPPKVDEQLKQFLLRSSPFYASLAPEQKTIFEQRVFFYMMGNDFSGMNMDNISEDMKAAVAIYPVTMTFNQSNFMLAPFERIVFYKHPFPSPNHRFLHACETDEQDGVIIFSLEQLIASQLRPDALIYLGFYEYAQVYQYVHKDKEVNLDLGKHWALIDKIAPWSKEDISTFTGFKEPSLLGSLTALFFTKPFKLKEEDPSLYHQLVDFYEIDPVPVLAAA